MAKLMVEREQQLRAMQGQLRQRAQESEGLRDPRAMARALLQYEHQGAIADGRDSSTAVVVADPTHQHVTIAVRSLACFRPRAAPAAR